MKIYEIGTGYTPIPAKIGAATEIVAEQLSRAFLKKGVDVEIVDIASKDRHDIGLKINEVWLPGVFTGTDIKLGIMHKLKRVVYSVSLALKLRKLIKKAEDKVVLHFHNQYNLFFFEKLTGKRLRKRATVAYTNHSGVWRMDWEEIKDTIRNRYFQEAECMRRADVVCALNPETIENAVNHEGASREHMHLVYNGVNTELYRPLEDCEKDRFREKYGLTGKRVILQVGSVNENKGQARSLKTVSELLKKDKDMVFAFAGGIISNEYYDEVFTIASSLGVADQVKYLGMIEPGEELNGLYNIADATIISSWFEGFCMAIIESMAAGTPVMIDNNSQFSLGEGCVLYNEENSAEVLEAQLYGTDAGLTLREWARKNAVAHFSWEKIAQDYLELFDI